MRLLVASISRAEMALRNGRQRHGACYVHGVHSMWLRAAPPFLVAATAFAGSLGACVHDDEPVISEDALVDYGLGYGYGYEEAPPACMNAAVALRYRLPNPLHEGVCDGAQIDELVRCYVTHEGDPARCRIYFRSTPANATCQRCALSKDTATTYGALIIDHDGELHPNVAGCIAAATNDLAPDGCGAKLQLAPSCLRDACSSCKLSPADPGAGRCSSAARASVCAAYEGGASCYAAAIAADGPARECRFEGTPTERARQAIAAFCAP